MTNLQLFLTVLVVGLVVPETYAAVDGNYTATWLIYALWTASYYGWLTLVRRERDTSAWTHNYFEPEPAPRRTIRVTWYDDDGVLRRRRI